MAKGTKIRGITIEIGGDTTKLTDALAKVNKELKQNQNALKDVDKLLKFNPGNVELLTQKQKLLGDSITSTNDKLKQLNEVQKQLETQGKVGTDEWDTLQREIIDTQHQLQELEKEYKNFGSVAAQQVAAVGQKMKSIGDGMTSVGKTMTKTVTAPIVAGLGAAIKTTMDFDAEMSKVKAISGANAEEFEKLRQKASEMGATTKYTGSEAAQAFEYMAMAGWKTEDMLSGIEGIMYLAAASGEELATTSDIVTDALTAFRKEAKDSARLSDILAAAATNSNTNVGMMGESFKYVAPLAGSLEYSMEDVAIALGLMANSGIKADQAGTSLRNVLQRMADPTEDSCAAMQRLGISLQDEAGNMYSLREIMQQLRGSFGDIMMPIEEYDRLVGALDDSLQEEKISQAEYEESLESLNQQAFGAVGAEKARIAAWLGGARALSGLLAIANATEEDYNKLTEAIDGSSDIMAKTTDGSVMPLSRALAEGKDVIEQYNGAAEAMAEEMQDNASGDITILMSQIECLARSIGDILIPYVREVIQWLQGAVTWLSGLDEGTKRNLVTIAGLAAVIGPVLILLGKLTTGIGGLLTLAPKLVGAFGSIGGIFAKVAGGAGTAASSVGSLGSAAGSAAGPVAGAASSVGSLAKNALGFVALGAGILMAAGGLYLIAKAAIELADAGPAACLAIIELVGVLALLAAGAAVLGPALTAGAVGLVAFGGAIALVGLGVLEACAGVALMAEQLPIISEYGDDAAIVILALAGALAIFGAGTLSAAAGATALGGGLLVMAAGAGTVTVSAAALAVALAALTLAVGALAVAVGLLTVAIVAFDIASGNALRNVKNNFTETFEGIKSFVGGVVDWLKGIFSFKWELPSIKLPHFSITGSFSLNPLSVPSLGVEWYRKAMDDGMILNSPTIFGIGRNGQLLGGGEAGSEAVVGTDSLRSMITGAVAAGAGGAGDIIIPVYVGQEYIDEVIIRATQRNNYRSGGR